MQTEHTRMRDGSDWRRTLLPERATVQDAIRSLDQAGLQIVLVASDDGVLAGTLTDGDIRRGLLRGLTLESPIETIIHRDPLVVPPHMGTEMVLNLMRANRLRQLPIVDEQRRVLGLHLLDDLMIPGKRTNLMVILAGGKGTRLHPYTEHCPKPLLPVNGKPMLEHIIDHAKAEGFGRFVLAVHHLGHMIEQYFGNGSQWQVQIDYLREESPLGTAGALGLLNPRADAPFLVTNGDVLTDIRYGELLDFHCRHGAAATMAVRQHEWQHPFGVVHTNGVDIVGFEEKPVTRSHINAGIYVLDPTAPDVLRVGEYCDMPVLFGRLQERGARTIVYPMHEPWLDVGRIEDLERAR
ncbi:MAG TPA: nucleotidyltransferase family protein [Gemmatimonadaceae bacterium]|nr:nucleotidyltransferase family protein [Gemmatimonadaceae bacterium]